MLNSTNFNLYIIFHQNKYNIYQSIQSVISTNMEQFTTHSLPLFILYIRYVPTMIICKLVIIVQLPLLEPTYNRLIEARYH